MTDFGRLKTLLEMPKPGLSIQQRLAPYPRPQLPAHASVENSSVKAGVLVPLYARIGKIHLAFIKRTNTVLHHKDQIGFPGGQIEPGENARQAALREAWEELGIAPETVEVIGELTPLFVPPTNFCIYPAVGRLAGTPSFRPDPREVAEVIEIPLDHLADPGTLREEKWTIRGQDVTVPFYLYGRHKIWGATAMILAEFLEIARNLSSLDRLSD